MSPLPLIAHRSLDAIVAWRAGAPVYARQFLGEVTAVAAQLPPGQHVLNLCGDRYHFAVALLACVISKRVSLLPSSHTPEMVQQMLRVAPDVFCITDRQGVNSHGVSSRGVNGDGTDDGMPVFQYPESIPASFFDSAIPVVECAQIVAQVFTSGSTGEPVPHVKQWGSLVRSAQAEAQQLGIHSGFAILGSVPAQHMYGLESTVLLPLQSGAAFHAGHPFYPADICIALASLPHPRMLVTTPYHLRSLLADSGALPAADLLLSATAPLTGELAQEAETRFNAPLYEIYGCTETGQIASRRTTDGDAWQTLAGVRVRRDGDALWAEGGHIVTPTPLGDVLELLGGDGTPASDTTTFLLCGRHADQVNIAGKRSSLAYLNHQLNAIPGVCDGVFLLPPTESPNGINRLSALVVAPDLTPDTLTQALRARIDPVFLPRPLLFVDALPRNATGKLPRQVLEDWVARLQKSGVMA